MNDRTTISWHLDSSAFNYMTTLTNSSWKIGVFNANQITRMHYIPNITLNIMEYKNRKTEVTAIQDAVYMDCIQSAIDEGIDWVAAFDKDEFLLLHNSSSIIKFMDNHCQPPCGQISFNLVPIGLVNCNRYVSVPVTRRFQYWAESNPERDKWVKAIVNPTAVLQDRFWIHTFPLKKTLGVDGYIRANHQFWKQAMEYADQPSFTTWWGSFVPLPLPIGGGVSFQVGRRWHQPSQ